jgi:hypothetical protein
MGIGSCSSGPCLFLIVIPELSTGCEESAPTCCSPQQVVDNSAGHSLSHTRTAALRMTVPFGNEYTETYERVGVLRSSNEFSGC